MRVIVLGGGESGCGVALLAQACGHTAFVSDAGTLSQNAQTELDAAGISYEHGGHGTDLLEGADVVVKSPGIPWTVPIVAQAQAKRIAVHGEMEFCARYAAAGQAEPSTKPRIIGITGSNGKTTTTLLTGHLLEQAGFRVGVGGNVGVSYARLLLKGGYDVYVLELSSFQLEDIEAFNVDVGMVLNLSPDHLDRYTDGMRGYAAAKYRLKATLRPRATWLQATDQFTLGFAARLPTAARQIDMPSQYTAGTAQTPLRKYVLPKGSLAGPHNAANASFALTVAELVGADPEVLAKAVTTFRNAPHRLELVGTSDSGVTYVNDSKATNLDAVAKALASFEGPLIWIVGGVDKGNDYFELMPLVRKRVKAVVAMGTDNRKLDSAFGTYYGDRLHVTDSLTSAMAAANLAAEPGDVVLLSPACASFDLFRNYEDRGDQFRAAALALPNFKPASAG